VKTISIILALYLLAITTLPCTDNDILGHPADTIEINDVSHQDHHHDYDHDHSEDSCPPMCHCTCCGMIAFVPSEVIIDIQLKDLYDMYIFSYKFDYNYDYNNSVWHPPVIAA